MKANAFLGQIRQRLQINKEILVGGFSLCQEQIQSKTLPHVLTYYVTELKKVTLEYF